MRHALAITLAPALVTGCQNPSATVVGAEPGALPDLRGATDAPPRDGAPLELTPADGAAATRTTSLDRGDWPALAVHQPRGQVEVQPTYYRLFEGFGDAPRATGAYPTQADALRVHGEEPTAVADGAAQPVIGIFWLAATPFHAVAVPPNTVRREPAGTVEWLPAAQAPGGGR
jgi:hypothetical protein